MTYWKNKLPSRLRTHHILLLLALYLVANLPSLATGAQSEPPLQKIDPSQAHVDSSVAPPTAPPAINSPNQAAQMPVPAPSCKYQPYDASLNGYGSPLICLPPSNSSAYSMDEQRVMRLEQNIFGANYTEHDLLSRLEHLEREISGHPGEGSFEDRLAVLESRVNNRTAFGGASGVESAPNMVSRSLDAGGTPALPGAALPEEPKVNYSEQARRQLQYSEASVARSNAQRSVGYAERAKDAASGAFTTNLSEERANGALKSAGGSVFGASDAIITIRAIPAQPKLGDYFPAIRPVYGNQMVCWKTFPVRVQLPTDSPEDWQKNLSAGINQWGRYVPLATVSQGEGSDIDVIWVNHMTAPQLLGVTRLTINQGMIHMQIFLLRPSFYSPSTPERTLAQVFAHELGHALGLLGHSNLPSDIMYPLEFTGNGKPHFRNSAISGRDLNTLKKIYEAPGLQGNYTAPLPMEWGNNAE